MTLHIDPSAGHATLINVFTAAPDNRDRLVALLKEGTDEWISKVPGFIASSLHLARDDSRVVIVGQWRSADAIAAMRAHPAMPAYADRVRALAQMESIVCDVAATFAAPIAA
jgi:quinol monooxygenase YgiN